MSNQSQQQGDAFNAGQFTDIQPVAGSEGFVYVGIAFITLIALKLVVEANSAAVRLAPRVASGLMVVVGWLVAMFFVQFAWQSITISASYDQSTSNASDVQQQPLHVYGWYLILATQPLILSPVIFVLNNMRLTDIGRYSAKAAFLFGVYLSVAAYNAFVVVLLGYFAVYGAGLQLTSWSSMLRYGIVGVIACYSVISVFNMQCLWRLMFHIDDSMLAQIQQRIKLCLPKSVSIAWIVLLNVAVLAINLAFTVHSATQLYRSQLIGFQIGCSTACFVIHAFIAIAIIIMTWSTYNSDQTQTSAQTDDAFPSNTVNNVKKSDNQQELQDNTYIQSTVAVSAIDKPAKQLSISPPNIHNLKLKGEANLAIQDQSDGIIDATRVNQHDAVPALLTVLAPKPPNIKSIKNETKSFRAESFKQKTMPVGYVVAAELSVTSNKDPMAKQQAQSSALAGTSQSTKLLPPSQMTSAAKNDNVRNLKVIPLKGEPMLLHTSGQSLSVTSDKNLPIDKTQESIALQSNVDLADLPKVIARPGKFSRAQSTPNAGQMTPEPPSEGDSSAHRPRPQVNFKSKPDSKRVSLVLGKDIVLPIGEASKQSVPSMPVISVPVEQSKIQNAVKSVPQIAQLSGKSASDKVIAGSTQVDDEFIMVMDASSPSQIPTKNALAADKSGIDYSINSASSLQQESTGQLFKQDSKKAPPLPPNRGNTLLKKNSTQALTSAKTINQPFLSTGPGMALGIPVEAKISGGNLLTAQSFKRRPSAAEIKPQQDASLLMITPQQQFIPAMEFERPPPVLATSAANSHQQLVKRTTDLFGGSEDSVDASQSGSDDVASQGSANELVEIAISVPTMKRSTTTMVITKAKIVYDWLCSRGGINCSKDFLPNPGQYTDPDEYFSAILTTLRRCAEPLFCHLVVLLLYKLGSDQPMTKYQRMVLAQTPDRLRAEDAGKYGDENIIAEFRSLYKRCFPVGPECQWNEKFVQTEDAEKLFHTLSYIKEHSN